MSKEEIKAEATKVDNNVITAVNANAKEREEARAIARAAEKPVSTFWKVAAEIVPPVLVIYGATCLFTCGQIANELYCFIVNAGLVYFGWGANIAYRLFRRSRRKA